MPDNRTRHQFLKVDTDTDRASLAPSVVDSARNIHFERGYVVGARGNVRVLYALPATGRTRAIGWCDDNAGGVLYFLSNSAGNHRLVRFTGTICKTLLEGAYLNLSEDTPVLGAAVLDGLLVYVDAKGELRGVPMDDAARAAAIAALATDAYALHLVHQPPQNAPTAVRVAAPAGSTPARLNRVALAAWQFAVQYEYASGERTPLGPYSAVLPRKRQMVATEEVVDDLNLIRLTLPATASPLVAAVRVLARRDDDPAWEVAATLTRSATGALPTSYDFAGVTTGEAVPAPEAAKLSEALPQRVGCMSVARSRVFVGDCTEGYAPPRVQLLASLAAATAAVPTTVPTTFYEVQVSWQYQTEGQDGIPYYVQGTPYELGPFILETGEYPNADSTYRRIVLRQGVWYADESFQPESYQALFVDLNPDDVQKDITVRPDQPLAPRGTPPPADAAVGETLPYNAVYGVGLAFYDALGRTGGAGSVVAVQTPGQPLSPVPQNVRWQLSSDPAQQAAEIPAWAVGYSLLLSRNRTVAYFQQFFDDSIQVYLGDNPDGSANLGGNSPGNRALAKEMWVSTTPLLKSGRGYVFEPGDRLRFTATGADYPILGVRAGHLQITPTALYHVPPSSATEIYRPLDSAEDFVLYERSPRYAITRTESGAAYSVQTGLLAGDAYLLGEGVAALVAQNPSFAQADLWLNASRGRAIPVVSEGEQVRRRSLIRHSGVKVQGTKLMGLSVWDATAQDDLPQEQGTIVRLGVADQTQADGSLLLAVQERGAESRYLGQSVVTQADGTATLALTKGVIGGGNALRGGYGVRPQDAASFFTYAGRAFWYCHDRREFVRYAQNGVVPLAETYQFQTRLHAVAAELGEGRVRGGYDPARNEAWLCFPGVVRETGSAGPGRVGLELGSDGSVDALPQDAAVDLPGVTLVWNEQQQTWVDTYAAQPDCVAHLPNTLLSFQNGSLWQHTPTAPYGSFYGAYTAPSLHFTVAAAAGVAKLWKNVAVESEARWLPTYLRIPRAGGNPMESQMRPDWLTYLEGIWRGAFRRDERSTGGLLSGRPLIGQRLEVTLTAPLGKEGAPLTAASVGWVPRAGQG